MKKIIENITKLIIAIIISSISCYGQNKNFIDQAYLETTAKVDTIVIPNLIYLNISLREVDTKGKVSTEKLEDKMLSALNTIGIDVKKQLKLFDLSTNFKKYFLKKSSIHKSKYYELEVYDGRTAGLVIYELESSGIANVNLSKTDFKEKETLALLLRTKAMNMAKKQAEALLKPLNQSVGKLLHLNDIAHNYYQNFDRLYPENSRDKSLHSENYNPPEVEFKGMKFSSQIQAKFAIN